ncbi:MAG: GGDEF domain-containing protein [Acetobacteraceae bacterium]
MLLDPTTLLITLILVVLLTSSSYLVVWMQDRQQTALLWMTAMALLAAATLAARVLLPTVPAIMLSNLGRLGAIGCIWMACRVVRGRPALPWALMIPGAIWLSLCLVIPGFLEREDARVAGSNLLALSLFCLALRELWLLDEGSFVARWWIFGVLAIQALICLGWGVFNIVAPGRRQMDFESLHAFAALALIALGFMILVNFGMIALVKERSERRYKQAAVVDALTGLGNRRHLNESLEQAVRDARRLGQPLALIMIDADSFKEYNDLYGHQQGDSCLQAIAGALRDGGLRKCDLVLRYGGEEFVVLLPDTTAAAAVQVAERLRLAVRGLERRHAGRACGLVTVSLGVAAMEPALAIDSAVALLDAADRALYRAKQLGRDRTVCAAPVTPSLPQLRLAFEASPGQPSAIGQDNLRRSAGQERASTRMVGFIAGGARRWRPAQRWLGAPGTLGTDLRSTAPRPVD